MYVFKIIQNPYFYYPRFRGMPYVEIGVSGNLTLYEFAHIILDCFDFDYDHMFGFYNNLKRPFDSDEVYELGFGDEELDKEKDVRKVKIKDVFKEPKKRMVMIFDFGDMWHFIIDFKGIKQPDIKNDFKVLKRKGEPFEQYPDYDDYEDDE